MSTLPPASASPVTQVGGKYLTVILNDATYGLAVLKVREIIRMPPITPVPRAPAHVIGVFNLRGRIVPVIDLRLKLARDASFGEQTCIVVTQVKLPTSQQIQMGLIVDRVEDVVNLAAAEIGPPPDCGGKVDSRHVLGMAKIRGQMMTLLDIDQVIAPDATERMASGFRSVATGSPRPSILDGQASGWDLPSPEMKNP